MAFTERYVTRTAGGGGSGTEGNPWTLAEGFDQAVAADRVNILNDGTNYSIGVNTITNSGSTVSSIVFRGYNSTIGDLEGQGRNTNGSLNTSNFPTVVLTGTLTMELHAILQNLNIIGALSSTLISGRNNQLHTIISCKVENTQSNGSAKVIETNAYWRLINSDLECSGASHNNVVDIANASSFTDCRFKGVANSILLNASDTTTLIGCLFIGNNTGIGLNIGLFYHMIIIVNSTFYRLNTAIMYTDGPVSILPPIHINNHVTDCGRYVDFQYYGTENTVLIEVNPRTRNNTNPPRGVGDGIAIGEVTTIIGGDATDPNQDFVSAGSDNFRLVSDAPGKAAGLVEYVDIGAYQREEEGGSVGGGRGYPRGVA